MATTKSIDDLSQSLSNCLRQKLTGEIILVCQSSKMSIYLNAGNLLWIGSKTHLLRRWQRAIDKSCKDRENTTGLVATSINSYQQLVRAISAEKITLDRAKAAIARVAEECFLELMLQSSSFSELTWTFEQNNTLEPYSDLALSAEQINVILLKAGLLNRQWQAAKLDRCLPTLSPVLEQEEKYEAMEVPIPKSYLQGNHTIWDIAAQIKISVIILAQSLMNLERQNVIKFQQVPDLTPTTNGNKASLLSPSKSQLNNSDMVANNSLPNNGSNMVGNSRSIARSTFDRSKPLIACIDDSPVLSHSVKKILASVGYQSLIIAEPMQGMGLLVKHRPNLILLDLLMPTVNGYAVCKFLRETTLFKTTPIVILTSKDSIVDRTKARLVGASDFLSKPPIAQDLLQIIRLHITDLPLA